MAPLHLFYEWVPFQELSGQTRENEKCLSLSLFFEFLTLTGALYTTIFFTQPYNMCPEIFFVRWKQGVFTISTYITVQMNRNGNQNFKKGTIMHQKKKSESGKSKADLTSLACICLFFVIFGIVGKNVRLMIWLKGQFWSISISEFLSQS